MKINSVIRKTMVLTASLMICLFTFSGEGIGQCKSGIYKLQDGRSIEVVQGSRGSEAFLLGVGPKGKKSLPDGSYLIGGGAKIDIRAGIATLQGAGSATDGKGGLIGKAGKPGDKRGSEAIGPKHDELLTNPVNEDGGKAGKIVGKRGSEAIGPKHDELTPNPESDNGKGPGATGSKAGKIRGKRGSETIGPKHDELTPNPESDSGVKGPGAIGGGTK